MAQRTCFLIFLDFVMGSLKRFYRNVLQNQVSFVSGTNEDRIHSLELESHLATVTYGNFTLTDAIRPSLDLTIIPEQGYKYDRIKLNTGVASFHQIRSRWFMPVLAASVSLEQLFETFLDLLDPLGETVNVVLETSHYYSGACRSSLYRAHIDLPILKSFLYDHEDLILNDGCTGISVFSSKLRAEVKFDEHKLILVYAKTLFPFEKILRRHNIPSNEFMPLLTDAEHVHITRDEYFQQFRSLQMTLGMDESYTTAR
ncbi:MAG: hypothetical protein LBI05_03140 [Planctomycetaceae bacterium]|jgi:hypothetical protein|nr:hypothetical protein [Planctomycetaceae bacterium]